MAAYDLDLPALEALIRSWGEPSFRTRQIWQGLYNNVHGTWAEFSNLPKALRDRLTAELVLEPLIPARQLSSSDGHTQKTAFQLKDGLQIETVLMRYSRGVTLCISSQAGCAMGCVFCATGQMGWRRHLTSGEIIGQVLYFARLLKATDDKLTNIVLMGMGEPFHNYENTLHAIDRLNDPQGFNFGARRFTISTVGLVPMIRRFADEKRQVNLAVSLHAADDAARSAMLPINKKYDIAEVLEACRYYAAQTHRRVSFEWALIQGVNDTVDVARRLGDRLHGMLCHVNAIPLNPTQGYSGLAASRQRALEFKAALERAGVPCTIRLRRGIDIAAGCGQLVV